MPEFSPLDPSSYSRPDLVVVTSIQFFLQVHFNLKKFAGRVLLKAEKRDQNSTELILDVKSLNILSITDDDTKEVLKFAISESFKEFGSKLTIQLSSSNKTEYNILIEYETSPDSSGLQWLEPQQTAGKKHPYVFSQFQAICARSFLPCQDTPGVKTKYKASITCPKELTVVMSAILESKEENVDSVTFNFKQEIPVQSYLIALAIGALKSIKIGPRSSVWAEEEFCEAAAFEFNGTEKQLQAAEEICGPYLWGIYDLLVLPPSFPFGGMENPCLTFVTPTLLAGDHSLANVVAHEIAHSWTGNLVSNANFEHFWLNEGFTVFVERKILGRLEGKEVQDFQALGGLGELQETVDRLGKDNPLTKLVVDLKGGVHPDDAFSRVPYEKGQTFLRYLESIVGGPGIFEEFLRNYFEAFKFKSITTVDFKKYFENYFSSNTNLSKIEWEKWLYAPGMPPVIPNYDKTLINIIENLKNSWIKWDANSEPIPLNASSITNQEKIQLLQQIFQMEAQPIEKLKLFDSAFKLGETKNSEIKFRWLRIGIKACWEDVLEPTLKWVNEVGRMKFIRPLYRDLYNWEWARAKTIENFQEHRGSMMHVSAYTVAQDLHLK